MKRLKEVSIFYKIAELGRGTNTAWKDIKEVADSGGLENLTTKTFLNADNSSDYYDHAKLQGNYSFVYNDRLNLADIKRSFFDGFDRFMCYDNDSESTYRAYVTINTDQQGAITVMKEYETIQKQGLWFYYPDTRATHVEIYRWGGNLDPTWRLVLDVDLTEHDGLNGAYYLGELPFDADYEEPTNNPEQLPANDNGKFEEIGNYIIASEVNNPFVFKAEGYVQVGVGKVKAVSTITKAISQGQFGGFPLVAFSDNGVWALSISNTGIISTAKPMEREVINDNVQGITQSDDAVFFASKRGRLMAVVGTGNGVAVQSVSEQLCGKVVEGQNLMTFLSTAKIAYDYRDSLLWIFDGSSRTCWLYSVKSGTFSKYKFDEGITITSVVNDYPDYLLQSGSNIYSLLERPDINQDGNTVGGTFVPNTYSAHLITRPMKLENALALKSLMQVRHVLQFSPYTVTETHEDPETHESVTTETTQKGTMTMKIFASNNLDNNLDNWVELHSLRGTPWKYYKFQYDFSNLIATDRFAGTMLITQERRTNKLR